MQSQILKEKLLQWVLPTLEVMRQILIKVQMMTRTARRILAMRKGWRSLIQTSKKVRYNVKAPIAQTAAGGLQANRLVD